MFWARQCMVWLKVHPSDFFLFLFFRKIKLFLYRYTSPGSFRQVLRLITPGAGLQAHSHHRAAKNKKGKDMLNFLSFAKAARMTVRAAPGDNSSILGL